MSIHHNGKIINEYIIKCKLLTCANNYNGYCYSKDKENELKSVLIGEKFSLNRRVLNMRVNVCVKTNKVGSDCELEFEIDDDDLKDMSDEEREDYIDKIAWEYVFENFIDWNWYEVED
ncbi:TPA: hypothetical protein ACMV83_002321 [Clostridioides difficile]